MPHSSLPARPPRASRWSVISLSALLLVGACEMRRPLEPYDIPATIAISPREATIDGVGGSISLAATVKTASGIAVGSDNVAWTSLHPAVATVAPGGLVTATGSGTALISVAYQNIADTAIIHVTGGPDEPGATTVTISPSEARLDGIGLTLTLQATVRTETGETVSNPNVTWTSLHAGVATVSSAGLVTTLAEGTALITATYQGVADTATIQVTGGSAPPASASITVSPQEATLQGTGNTILLQATVRNENGSTVTNPALTWTTLNLGVATVTTGGLVTSAGEGTALITVAYQSLADTATIHVTAGSAPPPPPTGETWVRVLANISIQGDVVVPDGEQWLIGPGVQIAGNLRTVGGTIAMRPGSSLRFLGADPDDYVGGGLTYAPEFAQDIGLWIGDQGVLDIRGTPKTGWNRTGSDATWNPDDEYWVAPTAAGDYSPRRWYPGDPIPQIDPRVPPAEVVNVTRDIVIEGPGHIHIHSRRAHRIEYVQLRRMGVSRSGGPVLGRYALHLHMSEDGSRGTVIRGVAAINSEGTVFVPHASHGITMIDNVSVNSFAEGLWWDKGDRSHDITVDRLAVIGVHMPREVSGQTSQFNAVRLMAGTNLVIRNSVAAGAQGSSISGGFDWPSQLGLPDETFAIWNFHEGNVAHNSQGSGVKFWFNRREPHHVSHFITYRHGNAGIENGAYINPHRYSDALLLEDRVFQHSSSKAQIEDSGPARFERIQAYAREGPALLIGLLRAIAPEDNPGRRTEFIDCTLQPGPNAPKVAFDSPEVRNPFIALFRRCGVVPDDFVFPNPMPSALNGSSIIIEHEDGRRWEITVENGQKVVRAL